VSFVRPGKRQDGADPRPQLACFDELGDPAQMLRRDRDEEERGPHPAFGSELLVGLGHGGDEVPSGAEDSERARLRLATNQVEHGIHVPDFVLKALPAIIQHPLRSELLDKGDIVRSGRRDRVQPRPPGELHGVGTDIAGGPVDQDCLMWLKAASSNRPCQAVRAITGTDAAST
jgi:hypothetical protein